MKQLTAPLALRLKDDAAERVRATTHSAITEIQKQPALALAPLNGVSLPNGVTTPVPHKLGRRPVLVIQGTMHTSGVSAGTIVELSRDDKFINLQANGFGATIVVDFGVM